MTNMTLGMTIVQMHGTEDEVATAQMKLMDVVNDIRETEEEGFSIMNVNVNMPTKSEEEL